MKQLWVSLVLPAVAAILTSTSPVTAQTPGLSADEIIGRAAVRARLQAESGADLGFESTFTAITEHLDGDGLVEKTESETYRQYLVEGVLFEELIARDGESLIDDDRRDEQNRKEDFAKEVRERRANGEEPEPEDENEVEFDRDIVGRYKFTILREAVANGHLCWVIYLEPRDGDLPVGRNIDNALNSSTGRIWVVQDDYGVARVEFEMVKPVRFWGGIIGTLRNMTGRLEFTRVTSGVWLPDTIDIKIDLRILIRNIRRRIVSAWDEYIPLNIVN